MKRILSILAVLALSFAFVPAVSAHVHGPSLTHFANSHKEKARVIESYPVYRKRGQHEVCEKVKVPVYAKGSGAQPGEVVAGAIIGGVVGKIVTGKDSGAAAGAVIGGAAAASKKGKVIGYKYKTRCYMVNNKKRKLRFYESRVRLHGVIYRVRTSYPMTPGSKINMWVHN